jgi:hypothetical protein
MDFYNSRYFISCLKIKIIKQYLNRYKMNQITMNPLYAAILLFLVFFTIIFTAMIMSDVYYSNPTPASK